MGFERDFGFRASEAAPSRSSQSRNILDFANRIAYRSSLRELGRGRRTVVQTKRRERLEQAEQYRAAQERLGKEQSRQADACARCWAGPLWE